MFNQDIKRIGFACKFLHHDQSLPPRHLKEIQGRLTESVTTRAWMERQTPHDAYDKMWSLIQHNTQAVYNLIQYVSSLPLGQRMIRLGSDQLPFYTLDPWCDFYKRSDVRDFLERRYSRAGNLAREHDVRLSMHPGQFCCVVSDRDDVVDRSLKELEYHSDIARWIGYGAEWRDFKINIHLSGRLGSDGFQAAYNRMSTELRNMLTIENDEFSAGLDEVLKISHLTPIVFDTHHQMIHSDEFLTTDDDRWLRVIDSWRGVRPVIHYSLPCDKYMVDIPQNKLPDMQTLLKRAKRNKLRAHSDYYNHRASNIMVLELGEMADIMCEAKMKNLASQQLFEFRESLKNTM